MKPIVVKLANSTFEVDSLEEATRAVQKLYPDAAGPVALTNKGCWEWGNSEAGLLALAHLTQVGWERVTSLFGEAGSISEESRAEREAHVDAQLQVLHEEIPKLAKVVRVAFENEPRRPASETLTQLLDLCLALEAAPPRRVDTDLQQAGFRTPAHAPAQLQRLVDNVKGLKVLFTVGLAAVEDKNGQVAMQTYVAHFGPSSAPEYAYAALLLEHRAMTMSGLAPDKG